MREPPTIPHVYVRRRSVYGGAVVLKRPTDDILIVARSVWSRTAALVLAGVIGWLCSHFLYWHCQRLRLQELRVTDEDTLAVVLAAAGLLFSLALAANTLLKGPIQFDRGQGTVGRSGWFPGWWERDLADVVAIQVCRGKSDVSHGDRASHTRITLQYQVNLVFRDFPPTRRNVSEQKHRVRVERIGRQLADFLDVPLLNYVGSAGTLDATDAEARRLLS
jgi:hypothetical protein